jgi:hypothetical protein
MSVASCKLDYCSNLFNPYNFVAQSAKNRCHIILRKLSDIIWLLHPYLKFPIGSFYFLTICFVLKTWLQMRFRPFSQILLFLRKVIIAPHNNTQLVTKLSTSCRLHIDIWKNLHYLSCFAILLSLYNSI